MPLNVKMKMSLKWKCPKNKNVIYMEMSLKWISHLNGSVYKMKIETSLKLKCH